VASPADHDHRRRRTLRRGGVERAGRDGRRFPRRTPARL